MSGRAASSSDRSSVGDGRENVDDVVFQHLTLQDIKDGVRMFWDPEANQVFYVFAAEYQVTNNNLPTPKQLTTLMQRLGASPDDMPADAYSILLKKTLSALDSRTRSLRAVATNKPDMVQFYDWSASWLLPEWDGDIDPPQGLPPSSYGLRPVIPRRHTLGHKRLIDAAINIICKQPKESVNTGQDNNHGQAAEAVANAIQGSDDTNGKGNKDDAQLPAIKLTGDTGDVVEYWEVERILDSKPEGRGITMQVKRRGYPDPTWAPASVMCEDAPEAVADCQYNNPIKSIPISFHLRQDGSPNEIMSGMRPPKQSYPRGTRRL